jgi:cytochrome c-type biogenesis protein CcmH/NrfG
MEPQNWATLAFLYYELEDTQKAVATLEEAMQVIPDFAPTAQCIAGNIEAGNDPQEGC